MNQNPSLPLPSTDLEVKDAQLIFAAVWDDLLEEYGSERLCFPREFIWLGGAPGAGKGTNTPFIAEMRDITTTPIVVSDLLTSPQAVAIKNAGKMVGDREVIGLLFEKLLESENREGVIVDGFPRTKVQVECLKLFYHKLLELYHEYRNTPLTQQFRKPMFRIALLFVSEEVSVQRQLKRGLAKQEHNRQVRETGVGTLVEVRVTDTDIALCRNRYRTFKETTFEALQSLRQIFHFHFIDAEDDLEEVQQRIVKEFGYQSSLELSHNIYEEIRTIPVANQLTIHARRELVQRLEMYAEQDKELFQRVVTFIEDKMVEIIRTHAISGLARINTEDDLFDDPTGQALRIIVDILSERGYHATVDVHHVDVPQRINPDTWEITCRTKKRYCFEIRHQPADIRRGH